MRNPTHAYADRLVLWLCKQYGFRVYDVRRVPKWLVRLFKLFKLDVNSIAGLTYGNRVYVRDYRKLSPRAKIRLIAHELVHVGQYKAKGKKRYLTEYLRSKRKRARHEAAAFEHSIAAQLYFGSSRTNEQLAAHYAYKLKGLYRCDTKLVRWAYDRLLRYAKTIRRLNVQANQIWNYCYNFERTPYGRSDKHIKSMLRDLDAL